MTTKPLVPRKPSTLQCKQKRPPVPKKPIKLTSTDITTNTHIVTNTRPAKPTIPTKPKIQLPHKQPPPTPKKSLNAIWAVAAQRITHRHTSPISTFPYNNTNANTNINTNINTNTKPIAFKPKQEIQRSNTTPSNISHLTKTRSRGPKRRLPTKV